MPGYSLSDKWVLHCYYITTDFITFDALNHRSMHVRAIDWRACV